jgi:hypothetical protein
MAKTDDAVTAIACSYRHAHFIYKH